MPTPQGGEGRGSFAGLTRIPRETDCLLAAFPICLAEIPVSKKEAAPAWRMLGGPVNDTLGYARPGEDVYSGPLGLRRGGWSDQGARLLLVLPAPDQEDSVWR